MALKDWKRTKRQYSHFYYQYRNKIDNKDIIIVDGEDFYQYHIIVVLSNSTEKVIYKSLKFDKIRSFKHSKAKSQALKYAKNYMRKH